MKRRRRNKEEFSDRTRFNWGYHDGATDFIEPAFTVREQVDKFHDRTLRTQQVSKEQGAYFYGYREGVADAKAGKYARDSQPAWQRVSSHPENLVFIQQAA